MLEHIDAKMHAAAEDFISAFAQRIRCLFACPEAIRGGDDALGHARVARVVSGLADNDEFAARPILPEPPRGDERGA